MSTAPMIVFCVADARTMKEVAPVLQSVARVRWVPDLATLARMFMVHPDVAACVLDLNHSTSQTLDVIRQRAPRSRRVVLTDSCDLRVIRTLLETKMADELVYRPIEAASLLRAIGVARSNGRTTAATAPSLPK